MRKIFYDANLISQQELTTYLNLIHRLYFGELKYPNIKMLKGITYHGLPAFRAKINDKERLIYTYEFHNGEKILCILAVNDHNYKRLKRQLKSTNEGQIDTIDLPEEIKIENKTTIENIELTPTVPHNNKLVIWDEKQKQGHLHQGSIIFSGPPGAGKTLVLYNNLLRNACGQIIKMHPILFLSQSPGLINSLKTDYQKQNLNQQIQFLIWLEYLALFFPQKKGLNEEQFKLWFLRKKWQGNPRIVHYELSLLVALGKEKYLQLGKRQCYFADDRPKKEKLIKLLKTWQDYLNENDSYDPFTSLPPENTQHFSTIYCDETQNLPPAALRFLICNSDEFIVSLDSEQCLLSSPYIHNCLKELLYKRYKNYEEIQLTNSWRCSPEIIAAGNHLMDAKHSIDGPGNRREYKGVKSMLPQGSGIFSWVNEENLCKLEVLGKSAGTVVIVDKVTEELRRTIQKYVKSNNILTPNDALGLEFDYVILWNPFSERECFRELAKRKNLPGSGLSLEQWNAFNAIYVSLTRAQKAVYIYDDMALKRLGALPELLLGKISWNVFDHSKAIEESKIKWLALVKKYLEEGQIENAKEVMRFHLDYKEILIDTIVKTSAPKEVANINLSSPINSTTQSISSTPLPLKKEQKPTSSAVVVRQANKKPVKLISEDEKRIELILAKFNKATLVSLFKEKDCMRLLFEIKVGSFGCLFSSCMADKTKFIIFKKFIKENGKLVAEKFELYRLIEAYMVHVFWFENTNKNERYPLLSFLYQNKLESILHILLEKFTLAQRAEFLIDSLTYPEGMDVVNKDTVIESLLTFELQTFLKNRQELINLFCKPTRYKPEISYAYPLCGSSLGTSIIEKSLTSDKTLFNYISRNLYKVPTNLQSSIFCLLTQTATGIKILEILYEVDPRLLGQLTMDDLFYKEPVDKEPVFYSLLKQPLIGGLALLNKLISPAMAAKIPHSLPSPWTLFFLSCSEDGTQIINRMMDAQDTMIAQITGPILFQLQNPRTISMFALLSKSDPAILNRLLDFHGKKFVKELTEEAMFHPILKDGRSAYEFLQEFEEGKRFLKRLTSFGWKLPNSQLTRILTKQMDKYLPWPAKMSFFTASKDNYYISSPLHATLADTLLWYIFKENVNKVMELVNSKPYLLLKKGNLTDSFGNRYKNITPFEYCQLTNNTVLQEFMPNICKAWQEAQEQITQKESLHEKDQIQSDFSI